MMQVMLSVPVPSDMVISPFAIPWFINSSIMKDVSPLTFTFLVVPSFFDVFVGEAIEDYLEEPKPDFLPILVGEPAITPFLGPLSLF